MINAKTYDETATETSQATAPATTTGKGASMAELLVNAPYAVTLYILTAAIMAWYYR